MNAVQAPCTPPVQARLRLFGVAIVTPPAEHDMTRFVWLGVRFGMSGSVSGAVLSAREFGVDAMNEHAGTVLDFGLAETPDVALANYFTLDHIRRGFRLLNEDDKFGRPIITAPGGQPYLESQRTHG